MNILANTLRLLSMPVPFSILHTFFSITIPHLKVTIIAVESPTSEFPRQSPFLCFIRWIVPHRNARHRNPPLSIIKVDDGPTISHPFSPSVASDPMPRTIFASVSLTPPQNPSSLLASYFSYWLRPASPSQMWNFRYLTGNRRFRYLVADFQPMYLTLRRI